VSKPFRIYEFAAIINSIVPKEKIIVAGKYLFLAGVALLIVRNNSYPFFIKRSSDILFALSAITALYVLFRFRTGYENFIKNKNIIIALLLICSGLIAASLSGYFFDGTSFTKEGILNVGRFSEVFLIIFLVSFFQSFDESFYKKAALAQLSTLAYLPTLFFPHADFIRAMHYRFDLFENWPSNVGYYLIPSFILMAVFLLKKAGSGKKIFALTFAATIGLSAILLWTQTRAAWLGLAASFLLFLFLIKPGFKKAAAAAAIAAVIFMAGFSILKFQPRVKDMVVSRVIPASNSPEFFNSDTKELAGKPVSGLFSEPYRINLWKIYSDKLAANPLGLGVNYEPVNVGQGPQGPHNTILEFLVLAGPLGLAGFIWLIFSALKNVFIKIKNAAFENRLWFAYLFSSLAGLLVASMFDNMSLFHLSWLILGMALFI